MDSLELVSNDWDTLRSSPPDHRSVILAELSELLSYHSLEFLIQLWINVSI